MKRSLIFAGLLLTGSLLSADSESVDLFANPEPDTPADTSQTVSLDAFTGQSVKFFETLTVEGYFVGGYKDDGNFVTTPVNALDFGFGSDLRLDRTARAYASLSLQYPKSTTTSTNLYNPYESSLSTTAPTDLQFTNIDVKELFLDYSLGNAAIIRLGRQTATWGQGRIFNPGNLVTGIGDGMAVKLSTAVGPVAFTGAAIKNDDGYGVSSDKDKLGINSLAEVGLAEYSSEWFSLGVSGFYHIKIGSKADAYLKTSLWGADLFVEGVGEYGSTGNESFTAVGGLYREFGDRQKWLKLQVEGLMSGRGSSGSFTTVTQTLGDFSDWTLGVAATSESLSAWTLKPSVMWLHTFLDGSGQVVVGFVSTVLPHIDITLGYSHIYGGDGSRYVVNNPDSTEKRRDTLMLKAAFTFELKN